MEECITQLLILIKDSVANIQDILVKEENEKVREILMQHTKALEAFRTNCSNFLLLHKLVELMLNR